MSPKEKPVSTLKMKDFNISVSSADNGYVVSMYGEVKGKYKDIRKVAKTQGEVKEIVASFMQMGSKPKK